MTTASGDTFPAEGFGSLDVTVYAFGIPRVLKLKRVMYVPSLSYNLFSLKAAAHQDHGYWGDKSGIRLHLKEGGEVHFAPYAGLYCISGCRSTHATSMPMQSWPQEH